MLKTRLAGQIGSGCIPRCHILVHVCKCGSYASQHVFATDCRPEAATHTKNTTNRTNAHQHHWIGKKRPRGAGLHMYPREPSETVGNPSGITQTFGNPSGILRESFGNDPNLRESFGNLSGILRELPKPSGMHARTWQALSVSQL